MSSAEIFTQHAISINKDRLRFCTMHWNSTNPKKVYKDSKILRMQVEAICILRRMFNRNAGCCYSEKIRFGILCEPSAMQTIYI